MVRLNPRLSRILPTLLLALAALGFVAPVGAQTVRQPVAEAHHNQATAPPKTTANQRTNNRTERWLYSGKIASALPEAEEYVAKHPSEAAAKFQLGTLKFLRAIERFGQTQHRYGLTTPNTMILPLVRLPVPKNGDPEEMSYEDARQMIDRLVNDLADAEKTLQTIGDADFRVAIDLKRITLDLDRDGENSPEESLWKLFAAVNRRAARQVPEEAMVYFDGGDADWLQGYCHVLQALGNVVLAHDFAELHARCGHLFYPRIKSEYTYLKHRADQTWSTHTIADLIATVHLLNFEVVEPRRMQTALAHLESMIDCSRTSWKKILAETDNEKEWLPGPTQTAALTSVRITPDMVDGWHTFLDEAERILAGEKLAPFWRISKEQREAGNNLGVNFRRVFTEPRRLDLVLWAQGTAAQSYLEEGTLTDERMWRRLSQTFRGQFWGFAMWIN